MKYLIEELYRHWNKNVPLWRLINISQHINTLYYKMFHKNVWGRNNISRFNFIDLIE